MSSDVFGFNLAVVCISLSVSLALYTYRGEKEERPVTKDHKALSPVARSVREKLKEEIDSRMFIRRFTKQAYPAMLSTAEPLGKCSFAFDIALFFYPACASLSYVRELVMTVDPPPERPTTLTLEEQTFAASVDAYNRKVQSYFVNHNKWRTRIEGM